MQFVERALKRARVSNLRASVPVALTAAVLIAITWWVTLERIDFERGETIARAMRQNENLAIAYEEQTIRTLKGIDQALAFVKHEFEARGPKVDIRRMIENGTIDAGLIVLLGATDERGNVVLSSVAFEPTNVADREYFKVHERDRDAGTFVGKPILGRLTVKWAIPISRRVNKTDGSFGGVAVAGVDPLYFTNFYQKVSLGERGVVTLVGLDGVTRARRVGSEGSFGEDMSERRLFDEQGRNRIGSFVGEARTDGVTRFLSYRTLTQFPLIVTVGTAQSEVMAPFHARERRHHATAAMASTAILVFAAILIAAWSRRLRALESLRESEARYRATFGQNAIGIVHSTLDGHYIDANAKASEILGYTHAELRTMTASDVVVPEELAKIESERARLIAGEVTGVVSETRCLRKDGTVCWIKRGLSLVRDAAGEPRYFISLLFDITERKRLEAVLRHQEERARVLFDTLPLCVGYADARGRITFANALYRATYASGADPEGRTIRDVLGEDTYALVAPRIQQALAGEEVRFERSFTRSDGSTGTRLLRYVPDRDDSGEVVGIFALIDDITERKRVEDALRMSESELKEAQRLARLGSWEWQVKADISTWSEELYRIFECDPNLPAPSYAEHSGLYAPESWARLKAAVEETLKTGVPYALDLELLRPGGMRGWIIARGEAVRDASGTVTQLRGTAQDITERKLAEHAALRQFRLSEAFFSGSVTCLVILDRNFNFLRVNAAYARACGKAIDAFPGRNHFEMYPSDAKAIFEDVVRTKRPFETVARAFVFPDQTERGVTYWDWTLVPILDANDEVEYLVFTLNDVTKRVRGEQALAESEARFRGLAEQSLAGIAIRNQDRFLYVNPKFAEMFGYTQDELMKVAPIDLVAEQDRARMQKPVGTRLSGEIRTVRDVIRGRRKDGSTLYVESHGSSVGTDSRAELIVIAIDITERKRAADVLERSMRRVRALSEQVMKVQQEERDALARELHDELGQTLTALKVNLQMLEPFCTGGDAEDHLTEALMIAGRALEQVRGITLDLRPPGLEALGLAAVLEAHVGRLARAAGWRSHFEAADLPARLPPGLEMTCFRVAQESLTNSMRHAQADAVWVALGLEDGDVALSVRDNGRGFDVAPMYDGASSTTFGLIGMQERVRQLGGQLTIRSDIGHGTEVRARFPWDPAGRGEPGAKS